MKVRKLLGGLLAGALLLTSVPLMDAGRVTAKAEESTEDTRKYYQLYDLTAVADSAQGQHPASNAVDGDLSSIWHTGWNTTPLVGADRGTERSGEYYIDSLKTNNSITITLKRPAHVSYLKYTTRTDLNHNGGIRTMHVEVKTLDNPDFTPVNGQQYDASDMPVGVWERGSGVTYSYKVNGR